MKIIRLILFIPAFLLAILLGNVLFDILFYLLRILYYSSMESSPLSYIWEDFLKSMFISSSALYIGILVYPFQKKLFPLIFFSVFYFFLFISLYVFYSHFWEIIVKEIKPITLFSQVAALLGILFGLGYIWYSYIKDELDF
jgi:hypothetical protein